MIVGRLCGHAAHDATSLSLGMLYNPSQRRADPDLLARLQRYTEFLETVPRTLRHEILNPVMAVFLAGGLFAAQLLVIPLLGLIWNGMPGAVVYDLTFVGG